MLLDLIDVRCSQNKIELYNDIINNMSCTCDTDNIVLIVRGKRFPAKISQLRTYPKTMLGAMFHERNSELLQPVNGNEYVIDRNDTFFGHILDFYKSGELTLPEAISDSPQSDPMTFSRFMCDVDYFLLPVHELQMQKSIQLGIANMDAVIHLMNTIIYDAVSKLITGINISVKHTLGYIRIYIDSDKSVNDKYTSFFRDEYIDETIRVFIRAHEYIKSKLEKRFREISLKVDIKHEEDDILLAIKWNDVKMYIPNE